MTPDKALRYALNAVDIVISVHLVHYTSYIRYGFVVKYNSSSSYVSSYILQTPIYQLNRTIKYKDVPRHVYVVLCRTSTTDTDTFAYEG
jgi:hypothetical protein